VNPTPAFLAVCLNPTLQKTLVFTAVRSGEVNRCLRSRLDASGKGVNVARVLVQLGQRCTHLTHAGGRFRSSFLALAEESGVTVRAVDNTFGGLPEHSPVRIWPFPYWDVNDNGVFDSGDMRLDGLSAAMDPAGSTLTFPVLNSPPSVSFVPNPADPTVPQKQPDTTFTAATFSWTASDPDGNNTLRSYRIALNDTSNPANWLTLSLRDTIVTLVVPRSRSDAAASGPGAQVQADVYGGSFLSRRLIGQIPGLRLDAGNVLFVQVKDVAGAYSPAITMPSGTDRWFVRRPRGRLLIVNDYINSDGDLALSTYVNNLANIPGGQFTQVDMLNIGAGLSAADPTNAGWQRDLSVSFNKLGGVIAAGGGRGRQAELAGQFLDPVFMVPIGAAA